MVIEITNGIEHTQFVQLNYGVSRETYGNLLEDFVVLDYCSTFTWDKVEGTSMCFLNNFNHKIFSSDLPVLLSVRIVLPIKCTGSVRPKPLV